MKIKTYSKLIYMLAIVGASCFYGCSKDQPTCIKHTYNFNVDANDENKIPYSGTDTLVFISNANDTIRCIGSGKAVSQNCQDAGGSPDCPPYTNTNCFNNHIWNFKDSGNSLLIAQQLLCPGENTYSSHSYNLLIKLNSTYSFYLFATCISDPTCGNYLPSAIFNGKQYNNVTYLYRDYTDTTSKIFLTKNQGIIRIELDNQQQIWTLK